MRKISFIYSLLLILPLMVNGKEVITLENGTRIEGEVASRTERYIFFYPADGGEARLIYMDELSPLSVLKAKPEEENKDDIFNKKNIISFNYLEFGVLLNLHLSYERIISDGYLGLGLSYAMAFQPVSNTGNYSSTLNYNYATRYSFDICIYPTGQHRASYFIGPSLIYGTYMEEAPVTTDPDIENSYTSFLINNGVVFQVVPNFSMAIKGGVGIVREIRDGEYQGINASAPLIGFNVAFRF